MDLSLFFTVILIFSCSIHCSSEHIKNLTIARRDVATENADPGAQQLGDLLGGDLEQGLSGIIQQAGLGDGTNLAQLSCMQKVMPCQPYLHDPATPPEACCAPLKELIANDTECVCHVFNNQQILKSFNVTQEDALKIPKACGTEVDVSVCKNVTQTENSSSAGGSNDTTTGGSTSTGDSTSTGESTSTAESTLDAISRGTEATTEKTSETSETSSAENGRISPYVAASDFIAVLIALLF